jgi:ribosomal-protein-alanine N-acetyltransferase
VVPYEFTDPYTGVVYLVGSVSELDAVAIADWEYDPPYTMYNLRGSLLAIVEFLTGPYYSVRRDGRLVGFFCYGHAARVKHRHSERYYRDTAYLDIGLGLHPQACGQGYGLGFLTCGLAFAKAHFGVSRFRLTAVSTNYRALKVYTRAGFREIGRFERQGLSEPMEFVVMTLDLDQVPGAAGPLSEAPPDYSGPGRP